MDNFERILCALRVFIYTHPVLLGAMTVVFPFIALTCAHNFIIPHESFILWTCVVSFGVIACLMYLIHLRPPMGDNVRLAPNHPNIVSVVKAIGGVITLLVFTALDSTFKEKNGIQAILFCFSGFCTLLLMMVIFRIGLDYDLAGSFLAASFGLFFELSQTVWDYVYLVVVTCFLAAIKGLILEGSFVFTNQNHP